MHRYAKLALSALLPATVLAGCSDWLSGPKLTENPNAPTTASRDALLIGIGVGQTTFQAGDLARLFSMWMQSMAGTDRQAIPLDLYQFDEDAFSGDWSQVYAGGGLIDIRALQTQALTAGDTAYAGVAKVWEALTMGTAADIWGDIPYSQAVNPDILTPELDPQMQVYSEVQAQLDTAIAYLQCASPGCAGPGGADLFYQGDLTKWLALAHTLKARFYMHTAEADPSSYALALAQTDSGISSPDGDFTTYQSMDPNEQNLWFQFIALNRQGYISAGKFLVDLLQSTNDPRLAQYYAKNSSGTFEGSPPGGGEGNFSTLSDIRLAPDFRQPVVTFAENELIRAEAALHEGQQGIADQAYNAERQSQGVSTKSGVSLTDVMTEKYIALFQQIEVWNDYKRTCIPDLTPANGAAAIPARLLYPLSTERNANPNIPSPDQQPARNTNDPNACP